MVQHSIRTLPIHHNGRLVTEATFSGQNFSREQIMEIAENFARRAPNYEFVALIPYSGGWRSGRWFDNQQAVSLFSLLDYYDEAEIAFEEEPELYNQFKLYVRASSPQAGGCNGKYNDCLWDCLRRIYGTKTMLPNNIREPKDLKDLIGIERKKPVPVKLLSHLEKKIKTISINICGDANYISQNNSGRVANIILRNGHYSLANPDKGSVMNLYTKPKKPLVYKIVDNHVYLYDGNNTKSIPYAKFLEIKKKRWSSPWCLIPVEKNRIEKRMETLEETYERFNEESNTLRAKTEGFIDLNRTGGSYKITALRLFQQWSKGAPKSEPLSPQEAKWISDAMMGGIIWGEKNWKGEAEQYDYTSMYPFLMKKKGIQFPVGAGEFYTLKDFEEDRNGLKIIRYGLYKATVEKSDEVKWFRYNVNGIYTFIDLKIAQEQGLKITLSSCSPNALIYDNSKRVAGSVLFATYVERLFKLKCEGGPGGKASKRILNILWGALSERNKKSYLIGEGTPWTNNSPFEAPEGEIFDIPTPIGKNQFKITTVNPAQIFKGLYPRIGVFLLAQGRLRISRTISDISPRLKRVHTDGFIVEAGVNLPISEDAQFRLGALKLERQGYCEVKNAVQIRW